MLYSCESPTQFLNEELVRRISGNPQYSQRAFARQLSLSPGELSEVLRGKRKLSSRAILKVAKALNLSASEARFLNYLAQKELGKFLAEENAGQGEETPRLRTPEVDPQTLQLSLDHFHLVSDWYCFAILNLAECDDFQMNEKWIARRLGISVNEVRSAFERLERVGLATQKKGKLSINKDFVLTSDGTPSEAIRAFHRSMLHKAIRALDTQSIEQRDISGIGLGLDPRKIPALKKDISDFLDEIVARYGRGAHRKEVYQCEVALFRLTESGEI